MTTTSTAPGTEPFAGRSSLGSFGQALLLIHLILSPIVFSRRTAEAFEFNKVWLLQLTALLLLAGGLVVALQRLATAPDRQLLGASLGKAVRDPLALGFLLYWLSALLSTLTSVSPLLSLRGAEASQAGFLTVSGYTVLFFATRGLIRSSADCQRLMLAPVLAAAVATSYALVQRAGADGVVWTNVSAIGRYERPFATLGHANLLSAYLVMAFPAVLYLGWRARQLGPWGGQLVAGGLGLALVVVVGLCLSRGAWLALGVTIGVLGPGWGWLHFSAGGRPSWWGNRRLRALALGTTVVAPVLLLSGWMSRSSTSWALLFHRSQQMGEVGPRQHIWSAAWRLYCARPVLGWGVDSFGVTFPRERTPAYWHAEWNTLPDRAHNEGLHLLATQGTVGGSAGLLLLLGVGWSAWRAWQRAARNERILIVALVAGIAGFLVQSFFSFNVAACGTLLVTYAALLSRLGQGTTSSHSSSSLAWPPLLLGALLAMAILIDAMGPSLIESEGQRPLLGAVAIALVTGVVLVLMLSVERPTPLPEGQETRAAALPDEEPALDGTPWWVTASQGLVWAGALALLVVGMIPPMRASWACAEGMRLQSVDPLQGILALENACELDPQNEYYWDRLGLASYEAGVQAVLPAHRQRLLTRSQAALVQALRLVPAHAEARANLGRVQAALVAEGLAQPADAYASFDQALRDDPSNVYTYLDAARLALNAGEPLRGRDYVQRALSLYPDFPDLLSLQSQLAQPR